MSFPRYPAYLESGFAWLGAVPAHWAVRRLGHFFAERREKVSDRDFLPLSVTKGGVVPQLETAAKTDDGENRKKVLSGDFVINSRSDRKGSAGLADVDGSVSLISTVLRPQGAVHGRFIHHLLRSTSFQEEFYRFGKGIVADLWSTNYGEMRNIVLAMPPLDEQRAIATFLDRETAKIDALVTEQRRLMDLLQEKRQAVITHAVTKGLDPNAPMKDSGVEWLGEVPAHWRLPSVGDRYAVELGKMLDEKRVTGQHLTPYLRNTNVQWDAIHTDDLYEMDVAPHEHDRYLVQAGDLLVCEGGEVGRAAIWDGRHAPCAYQKALHRLRPRRDAEVPRFMLYTLRHAAHMGVFTANGNQNTIPHLTAQQLRRYRFPTPPRAEQEQIVQHLDLAIRELESVMACALKAIDVLEERRAALITAAVTGQIDVRGLAAAEAA